MATIAEGPLTSLAFCWELERADGAGIALTSSDRDIRRNSIRYRSEPGMTPAAITRRLGFDGDSGEVAGALSAEALSEADLAQGRWNGARLKLLALDWADQDGAPIDLLGGEIGEVSIAGEGFTAELRGAASRLSRPICPRTSPECRAQLGDKQCRVDLSGRSERRAVVSASDNMLGLDEAVDGRFLFGRLRFLSGENCGLSSVILAVNGVDISLRDLPPGNVDAGTVVEIREGCDKRFSTCTGRFQNGANFRGEPHLPGIDLLTRYPGA